MGNVVAAATYKEAVASPEPWEVPLGVATRLVQALAGRREVFPVLSFIVDHEIATDAEFEIRHDDLEYLVQEADRLGAEPDLPHEAREALSRLASIARDADRAGASVFGYSDTIGHEAPAWRERADSLVHAWIREEGKEPASRWRWEQIWARRVGENRYEVCCIPFFAYDLALGDEIETGRRQDRDPVLERVAKPSGHYTFRVWFRDPALRGALAGEVRDLGCLTEWRSLTSNLLAVDAPSQAVAQRVADLLLAREKAGGIQYETGRTR